METDLPSSGTDNKRKDDVDDADINDKQDDDFFENAKLPNESINIIDHQERQKQLGNTEHDNKANTAVDNNDNLSSVPINETNKNNRDNDTCSKKEQVDENGPEESDEAKPKTDAEHSDAKRTDNVLGEEHNGSKVPTCSNVLGEEHNGSRAPINVLGEEHASNDLGEEHNVSKGPSNVLGEEHNGSKGPSNVLGEEHSGSKAPSNVLGEEHNGSKGPSNVLGEEHSGSKVASSILVERQMPNQNEKPSTDDKEEEKETNKTGACEIENKETVTYHKDEINERQEHDEEDKHQNQTELSTRSPDDKEIGKYGEQDTFETKEAEVTKPPTPSNDNEDPDDKTQEDDNKLDQPRDMQERSSSSAMISNIHGIKNQGSNVHHLEQGADKLENPDTATLIKPDTNETEKDHSLTKVRLGEERVIKPSEQMENDIDKDIDTSLVLPDTIKVVENIKIEPNMYVDVTNKDQADKYHDEKTVQHSDEKREINFGRQMEIPNEAEALNVTEPNDYRQAANYQSKGEEREAIRECLTRNTHEIGTDNKASGDNTLGKAAVDHDRTDAERPDEEAEAQLSLDRDAPELDKHSGSATNPRESPEKGVEEVFITSSRDDEGLNQGTQLKSVQEIEDQMPDIESKLQNVHSISPPLIDINTSLIKQTPNTHSRMKCNNANTEDSTKSKAGMENKEKVVENVDTNKLDNETRLSENHNTLVSNDTRLSNQQEQGDTVDKTEPSEHHTSDYQHANRMDSTNIEPSTGQITGHSEDETNIKEIVRKFEQSNSMYFTGRLPTLEPSRTITPKADKENEEPGQDNDNNEINGSKGISNVKEIDTNTSGNNTGVALDKDDNKEKEKKTECKEESTNRISTPSREIQKLIREINAPAQIYTLSKERPLTPRDKFKSNTELSNLQEQSEESENTSYNGEDKQLTVGELNTATSKIMSKDIEKQSAAKYDELPHMKNILQYTVENQLREPEERTLQNDEGSPGPITRTVTEITDETNMKDKTMESHQDDKTPSNYEIEQTAMANQETATPHENLANKTSNSENDLKEMIAAAKRAIEDDETAIETTTEGASGFSSKGHSTTSGAWKTDESTYGSNYDGLICSKCLRLDANFVKSGFCHECQEYLCGDCRKLHKESADTMHHYIMDSYCTNELKARKFIRATSYCKDCEIFLCGKCTVQHSGFRAFRRHKIVQSSFISRPTRPQVPSESSVSLDETTEHSEVEEHERAREYEQNRQKKRKKYVFEKQFNSPYGSKFDNVPESLYPGKNKNLAISYTSNPQWPYSSIPTLPYLVKPGSLQQRAMKTPYLQAYRTPFYTKTKKAFNPNVVKLKVLQSRYNLHPERKTSRRKEAGLFTARPLKNTEGVSLPDISSIRSINMDGRLSHYGHYARKKIEKTEPIQASNKLKTAEFIRDECLSIPFPSDELPCLIGGMEVLFDGRLVVLDKRNNNIKLFSRRFNCKASLQFQNRIVDFCASSIYPTDIYLATPKNLFEISAQKGLEVSRKMKVEIKRIEGLVCWKYGVAIVSMKSDLSWEIRLLDFRGNVKSKLEILNPFTCEIERSNRYHVVASRGGKYLTLSDVKNACAICFDVTTRCVVSETLMLDSKKPSYLAADHQNNVYVSCGDEVQQVSARGRNLGVVVRLERDRVGRVGCIAYNAAKEQLYVQMKSDVIAIYKMRV